MSKYKEQRLKQIEEERQQRAKCRLWGSVIVTMLLLTSGVWFWHRNANASKARSTAVETRDDPKRTLASLLALKPRQLEGLDIGLINLLCAEGLRGSEHLDLDKSLDRLDEMATRVRQETDRNMHRFRSKPAEYENSEAYFRMLMLVTVLQQDFGIIYNPDRVTPVGVFESNDKFFADSRDVFIHGLTGETKSGTCSSLPAFYIAVGRRLKYPLSLVSAKNHLFVRWEDQETRLNIEAAAVGMNTYDDAHYRAWPYPMTAQEVNDNRFITSMTAVEECAVFMSIRGHCLMAAGRLDEAIAAHEQAVRLAPEARLYGVILDIAKREAAARAQPTLPGAGMPPDPSLWDLPPETAWMLWHQQQAIRNPRPLLPGEPPQFMVVKPCATKSDWNEITKNAENYSYAEDLESLKKGGTLSKWPNSKYEFPPNGNNSNSFVRYMLKQSDVAIPDQFLNTFEHPGAYFPSAVSDHRPIPTYNPRW